MSSTPGSAVPVVILTDYGRADEWVGVLHLVLARLAPGVPVVDLTHDIPAHDVRTGALTVWRNVAWLAPGVVLAVVDPGVGTARRAVAIETVAPGGLWLVGPDNGLLLPAALAAGGIARAVALTDPAWHLAGAGEAGRGATFAGRDVFAPVAAHLSRGVDLGRLGPPVDPATLLGRPVDDAVRTAEGVTGEVLWVDRFGNAQLNVRPDELDHLGPDLAATLPGAGASRTWTLVRVGAYADLPPGAWGLVTDSYGLCSICGDRRSAAEALALRPGDPVLIRDRPTWW
jgi:S-adenosylmethionine hydrolase